MGRFYSDPGLALKVRRVVTKGCPASPCGDWRGFHASAVYQLSTRRSQHTTPGDRAQAAIGLTHRLIGAPIDHHADEHDGGSEAGHHGKATLDGVIELNGEWEGRQREDGAIDRDSGGEALFLSPGLRLNTGDWSFIAAASLPLAQDIRVLHSETSYRVRVGVSRGF